MFNSCANVYRFATFERINLKKLSEDIDSKEIVIRHGESKSCKRHGLDLYGKRYNIGVFSHQTFHKVNGNKEPQDFKKWCW